MIIRQRINVLSISTREEGKQQTHSPTYCIMDFIMDNWENMLNLTHTMMIMKWCTVQTNEYYLQGKMYPTICTHHKVHNNNEIKFPVFPERICWIWHYCDRIWCNKHLRHTATERYDNNGKGGYFRFDDDNNMSFRYILSITYTEMG